MVYFQIEKHVPEHYTVTGPLQPGETISGQKAGEDCIAEIVGDNEVIRGGGRFYGEMGATLFDKKGRFSTQKAIVYLPADQEIEVRIGMHLNDGAAQDGWISLWRRMLEQTRNRKPGQRSFTEKASALLSLGWTERFS